MRNSSAESICSFIIVSLPVRVIFCKSYSNSPGYKVTQTWKLGKWLMCMSSLSLFHYFKVCAMSLCLNTVHNSCFSVGILAKLNVSLVIGCILTLSSGWTFSEEKLGRTRHVYEHLDPLRWEGSAFARKGLQQLPRGLGCLLVFHFSSRDITEMTFSHGRFCSVPWNQRLWISRAALASSPGGCPSHGADSTGPLEDSAKLLSPLALGKLDPWWPPPHHCPGSDQSLLASVFWDYPPFQLPGLLVTQG